MVGRKHKFRRAIVACLSAGTWALAVTFFLCGSAHAAPNKNIEPCDPTLYLHASNSIVNLAQNIELFVQPSTKHAPADSRQIPALTNNADAGTYIRHCGNYIAFPSGSEKFQIRFQLKNNTNDINKWAIKFDTQFNESVSLFDLSFPTSQRLIAQFPSQENQSHHPTRPIINFSLEPGEQKSFILEVVNKVIPHNIISIGPKAIFDQERSVEVQVVLVVTGFFMCLFLMALLTGVSTGRYFSLFYCGYLLSITGINLVYNGVLAHFGVAGFYGEMASNVIATLVLLAIVFLMFFVWGLLEIKTKLPSYSKLSVWITAYALFLMGLHAFLPITLLRPLYLASVIGLIIMGFSVSFTLAKRRDNIARLMLLSFIVLFIGNTLMSVLPTNPDYVFAWFTENSRDVFKNGVLWTFQLTYIIEASIISVAFALRAKEWRAKNNDKIKKLEQLNTDYQTDIKHLNARSKVSASFKQKSYVAENAFLTQAIKVIHRSISDPTFGVSALAEEMAKSESTLHRKIKAACGLSSSAFIQEQRLTIAQELIQQKAYLTVSEVAYAVGYASPKHFSKLYKKTFLVSPADALRL